MTYQEYKERKQSEFDNLPIFYAFSDEQFKVQMEKRGLTVDDTDKIYSIGFGGYYLRSDAGKIREWMNKPDELEQLMSDPEFAESAFYYEMGNHEYHINHYQGDWDVCSCFGKCEYEQGKTYRDYLKENGYSDSVIKSFERAKSRFWNDAVENDWF